MKLIVLPILALIACTPEPRLQPEDIIGTWVTKEIQIQILTKDGGPNDEEVLLLEKDFPDKLGMKQNIGIFNSDGSYQEKFITMDDRENYTGKGTWSIEGDSLLIIVTDPSSNRTKFGVVRKDDQIKVRAYVDWDRDGAKDDLMSGTSELQK